MANDNIFQQYLAPPKSVLDYQAEYDQADQRKQALAQNALALAAGRQKFEEGQQASQRSALLRAALVSLPHGATDDQRIQAMRGTGTPEGFAAADALDKSLVDRRKGLAAANKDDADAAKTNYALRIQKSDQAIKDIAGFQSPEEALASLQAHVAAGDVPADQAALIQQGMPQDPARFSDWKVGMIRNIMAAKEQMTYLAPDANTVANNARIKSEGAANRANQIKVQQMIGDRAGDAEPTLDQESRTRIAQQFLRGDKSGLQNLGRGRQGAANLVAIQNEITAQAKALGMTGDDIAARVAEFEGVKAGFRTAGTASARIENAAAEAGELAPLALTASRDVVRSGFLPFGKAQIMFDTQTNDPALRRFATANVGLATAYAAAMARGGKPTVSDMEHSRELLSTAASQPAYEATVQQMQAEIAAAQRAPKTVRQGLTDSITGKGQHGAAPAAAANNAGAKPSLTDIFGH